MAIQNTRLTNGTAANIFASNGTSAITTIHLCNNTGASVTCNIYIVTGSGVIASANNAVYTNLSITSQNTYIVYAEKFILNNGDSIRANCSAANSITATVSSIGGLIGL
jgi:orotate phosphoribosyltransferase